MIIGDKLRRKEFTGISYKDAYLKAVKWLSSNILAVNNSKNIVTQIRKVETKGSGEKKVELLIYVCFEEQEVKDKNCAICQEMNSAFFMQENKYKCYNCKIEPYRKRLQEKLDSLTKALKGMVY